MEEQVGRLLDRVEGAPLAEVGGGDHAREGHCVEQFSFGAERVCRLDATAYQLAGDAFRKSAASLLAVQVLRATSRGGHIAIQDAVQAQFGKTVPAFRSFSRIRRARNAFEYPSHCAPGPSADDVTDAITAAAHARADAVTILEQNVLTRW